MTELSTMRNRHSQLCSSLGRRPQITDIAQNRCPKLLNFMTLSIPDDEAFECEVAVK